MCFVVVVVVVFSVFFYAQSNRTHIYIYQGKAFKERTEGQINIHE